MGVLLAAWLDRLQEFNEVTRPVSEVGLPGTFAPTAAVWGHSELRAACLSRGGAGRRLKPNGGGPRWAWSDPGFAASLARARVVRLLQ